MDANNLKTQANSDLPLGYLLVVWDLLANRLSETFYKAKFSNIEKKAIWALEDLGENEWIRNEYQAKPKEKWEQIMLEARSFVKATPATFLIRTNRQSKHN